MFGNTEESKSLHLGPNCWSQLGFNLHSFICQMSVVWSNSCYHFAKFPSAENVCSVRLLSQCLWPSHAALGSMWAGQDRCAPSLDFSLSEFSLQPSISPVHLCICLKPAHMIICNHFLTTFSLGFRNESLRERGQCMTFFFPSLSYKMLVLNSHLKSVLTSVFLFFFLSKAWEFAFS